MNRRNHITPRNRTTATAEANPLTWRYFIVILICGCILAAGFFLAARQHFSSMEYGIKNSRLRKQLEDLESENRRLLLAREVSLSPAEIKKTARAMGFRESETVFAAFPAPSSLNRSEVVAANLPAKLPTLTAKSAVTKTAYQRPAETPAEKAKVEKTTKKTQPASGKKDFSGLTAVAKLR